MKSVYDILLVEDCDDDALLFSIALRRVPRLRLACRVRDGDDAIGYLSGRGAYGDRQRYPYPDLILVDLKMPGLNGFDVLEWLRHQNDKPLICVYSSSEEPHDINKAMVLGADCFIPKGCGPEQLLNVARFVEHTCSHPPRERPHS